MVTLLHLAIASGLEVLGSAPQHQAQVGTHHLKGLQQSRGAFDFAGRKIRDLGLDLLDRGMKRFIRRSPQGEDLEFQSQLLQPQNLVQDERLRQLRISLEQVGDLRFLNAHFRPPTRCIGIHGR